ncbi:MAG: hypothetical protein J6U37_05670 [Lachnospiraceae bacterium]|nr:hypothetical protein [Lachnospiraceae bacterium]
MYEENTVMPVAPMGNGGGFGGDWGWIILLLLFAGGFGGFGGGFGGNEIYPWMNQADITTNGFQNLATQNQLTGIQSSLGDIQTQICGGFANAEVSNNARQIADLQQSFASQTAITEAINNLASQNASCCCEQRLASAQLQNTIQSENCADRAAISDGIRDILVASNANTQRILDMMCQDKIDAKNEKIADLQNQLNIAAFNASQVAQNNYLSNALTAQTQYFLGLYPPTATTTPATAKA